MERFVNNESEGSKRKQPWSTSWYCRKLNWKPNPDVRPAWWPYVSVY